MSLKYNRKLIHRAQTLRREMTKQERHLWYDFLSSYPVKFRKQTTIGNFIVDFYCDKAKLIIELDGSQHFTDEGLAYDKERDSILKSNDLDILRFSNVDIDNNFDGVCYQIDSLIRRKVKL